MLDRYLASNRGKSFEWGVTDCFTFCIKWADLITGNDVMSQYRYSSVQEGIDIIKKAGFSYSWEVFDLHYARTEKPVVGDLVAIDSESINGVGATGIKIKNGIMSVSNRGVAYIDKPIIATWRVK